MQRKCPQCGGLNVRRSSIRAQEVTAQHIFLSPYRCRDCRARFWVVSRNVYYLATIVGVAFLVGALAWGLRITPPTGASAPEQAIPDTVSVSDVAKLADNGDPEAEYELAMMYMNGSGVPRNVIEARKWLERSAEHGNAKAQYEFGLTLRDGRGAVQDYQGAMKWIKLAAEAGYGRAQYALGIMYRQGTGAPIDEVKAYTWLNLAAAQDVEGAAAVRDAVRGHLSAAQIESAQAEARRLRESRRGASEAGVGATAR